MKNNDSILLENIQDDNVKRTRSGRISIPPLAWWLGERVVTTLREDDSPKYVSPQNVDEKLAYLMPTDIHGRKRRSTLNVTTSKDTSLSDLSLRSKSSLSQKVKETGVKENNDKLGGQKMRNKMSDNLVKKSRKRNPQSKRLNADTIVDQPLPHQVVSKKFNQMQNVKKVNHSVASDSSPADRSNAAKSTLQNHHQLDFQNISSAVKQEPGETEEISKSIVSQKGRESSESVTSSIVNGPRSSENSTSECEADNELDPEGKASSSSSSDDNGNLDKLNSTFVVEASEKLISLSTPVVLTSCPISEFFSARKRKIDNSDSFKIQERNSVSSEDTTHLQSSYSLSESKSTISVGAVESFNQSATDNAIKEKPLKHEPTTRRITRSSTITTAQKMKENKECFQQVPGTKPVSIKSKKKPVRRKLDIGSIFDTAGSKNPTEGTLKRKHWLMKKLDECNKGHKDDLFEGKEVYSVKNLLELEKTLNSNSSKVDLNFPTPKLNTFVRNSKRTKTAPACQSCTTPSDFNYKRSAIDAYLYRRKKVRKEKQSTDRKEKPKKVTHGQAEIRIAVQNVGDMLKKIPENEDDISSEELNDYYFSDEEESVVIYRNYV